MVINVPVPLHKDEETQKAETLSHATRACPTPLLLQTVCVHGELHGRIYLKRRTAPKSSRMALSRQLPCAYSTFTPHCADLPRACLVPIVTETLTVDSDLPGIHAHPIRGYTRTLDVASHTRGRTRRRRATRLAARFALTNVRGSSRPRTHVPLRPVLWLLWYS